MKEKLVSVIIPAYNAEKYIEVCLNTIIVQTYKNLEIIIVNDGSYDKTERICTLAKDLAKKLGITIQAVSENIKTLIELGYITSKDGRSPYKITQSGIDKVKKDAISLRKYSDSVLETMNHYKTIWPAIAKEDLKKELKECMWILFNIKMAKKLKDFLSAEEIAEVTGLSLKTVLLL